MFRKAAKRASGKRVVGPGYVKKKSGRSNAVALTHICFVLRFQCVAQTSAKIKRLFRITILQNIEIVRQAIEALIVTNPYLKKLRRHKVHGTFKVHITFGTSARPTTKVDVLEFLSPSEEL